MMTSSISVTNLPFHVNEFKTQGRRQVFMPLSVPARGRRHAVMTVRVMVSQFREPNIPKMQLSEMRKRLFEVIPEPVKQVPWNNAGKIFLNKLLDAGEKALLRIFIPLFVLSAICDIVFSILRNKELLIPVGLFVGCAASHFFNETFQELSYKSEGSGSNLQLLYIGAFFVVTRFLCSNLSLTASVFFMHFANGGLMQVLWLWRKSRVATKYESVEGSVSNQDTS